MGGMHACVRSDQAWSRPTTAPRCVSWNGRARSLCFFLSVACAGVLTRVWLGKQVVVHSINSYQSPFVEIIGTVNPDNSLRELTVTPLPDTFGTVT